MECEIGHKFWTFSDIKQYILMPYTDDQIRTAVLNLFKKYDRDSTGYIEGREINNMCNDLARELGSKKQYSNEEINSVMSTLDKNQDGKVTLDELFVLMRTLNPWSCSNLEMYDIDLSVFWRDRWFLCISLGTILNAGFDLQCLVERRYSSSASQFLIRYHFSCIPALFFTDG